MKIASLTKEITHQKNRPSIQVLFESSTTKEIRIALKKGHIMKEHKTPFPIVVEIFRGTIDFGVQGKTHTLYEGSLIALDGNVLHDLTALEDSIVRLSLSLKDKVERVQNVETNQIRE